MSYIRTHLKTKATAIAKYKDNPDSIAFINNKCYTDFKNKGVINSNFKINHNDYKHLGKDIPFNLNTRLWVSELRTT